MDARDSYIYLFGDFRLDPAARELRYCGELLEVPRLVFDGLVLLVENRDRAIGRNELIKAVWGRSHVEDVLVTQVIMRLRRLLGDDSKNPEYIRTVAGFGYHWIADTEEKGVRAGGEDDVAHSSMADSLFLLPQRRRWLWISIVVISIGFITTMIYILGTWNREGIPLSRQPDESVAVLPLEVDAPDESEFDWIRLGIMDLIAGRLRDAGLPVPPSDSVVSALHAVNRMSESDREAALRHVLGAGVVVRGKAVWREDTWVIELKAMSADDDQQRVNSNSAGIIPAAEHAADRLLAALGQERPKTDGTDESLSELLQQARAASLAQELDIARSILASAPDSMRAAPELLHELAWVEFRAGKINAAQEIMAELLDHPALTSQPQLRAKVWVLRGHLAMRQQDDWGVGVRFFNVAIEALDAQQWAPELGVALALRGASRNARHEFNAAAQDLGRARALFEVIGDRLGVARVLNYFGNLEWQRKRPVDALPHLRTSLEIYEEFGHVGGMRANLHALLRAQIRLLRWPEALATSERLWALRERIQDPGMRSSSMVIHADVLVRTGRIQEAMDVLEMLGREDATQDMPFIVVYREARARAELALRRGHPEDAVQFLTEVLEAWPQAGSPVAQSPDDAAYLALLRQRVTIAAGGPEPAADALPEVRGIEQVPAYLIARGEWAAYQDDHESAGKWFRSALDRAEHEGIPGGLVSAADAYGRWLLARDRLPGALAMAGRVADWAEHDYNAALLQVAVFHSSGRKDAWAVALERAQKLAEEREIPAGLLEFPR